MNVEDIARVCHEVNRAYCLSVGDLSQPEWDEAPEWQRMSAIKGVLAHKANPHLTPEQSHELWCKEKWSAGWRLGPIKSAETKEHPCLVPYAELPQVQRVKDYLFKGVVAALL